MCVERWPCKAFESIVHMFASLFIFYAFPTLLWNLVSFGDSANTKKKIIQCEKWHRIEIDCGKFMHTVEQCSDRVCFNFHLFRSIFSGPYLRGGHADRVDGNNRSGSSAGDERNINRLCARVPLPFITVQCSVHQQQYYVWYKNCARQRKRNEFFFSCFFFFLPYNRNWCLFGIVSEFRIHEMFAHV